MLHNGRPADQEGTPIELLSPIFAGFMAQCSLAQPSAADCVLANALVKTCSNVRSSSASFLSFGNLKLGTKFQMKHGTCCTTSSQSILTSQALIASLADVNELFAELSRCARFPVSGHLQPHPAGTIPQLDIRVKGSDRDQLAPKLVPVSTLSWLKNLLSITVYLVLHCPNIDVYNIWLSHCLGSTREQRCVEFSD